MFEHISGRIAEITPSYVVMDVGGVGYFIHISLQTYSALSLQKEAQVYVHMVVRDDAHLLFGFASCGERELFRLLIGVSGVGPNTARIILSSVNAADLEQAIATANVDLLKQIKGIGLKTAQRIVVDLKGKLGRGDALAQIFAHPNNTIRSEALSALVMLGYPKGSAEKLLEELLRQGGDHTAESLVKAALRGL